MSARIALGPGLCLLSAFLCLAGASCFAMKTYTPEEATTRFTSEARLEEILDAAAGVLEANGFVIQSRSRTKLAALEDTRESPITTVEATECFEQRCTIVGPEHEDSGGKVQTIVYVTLTPQPDHTDVVINVEKRKSKIYSSDIKLMRKVAAAMAETLGEEISTEESKEA